MVISRSFGPYEIVRKLGRSMTDVYLAFDRQRERPAVLKIIERSGDSLTQLVLEAERRGAEIQKQLHEFDPRVVEVYEYGHLDEYFFIAMEYVEGENVGDLLRREHRLEPRRAAVIALEVCSQLERLHSFHADIDGRPTAVVHGDIKPSNIQMASDGAVRLLDFGIAKAINLHHRLTHHTFGSPSYCSPERLATARVDADSDLWAVGVTLYEMIAGTPPYQAENTRKLEQTIASRRPPRPLPAACPKPLRAVIQKALARDAAQRYHSAADFHQDLWMFLQEKPTNAEREVRVSWNIAATVEAARSAPRKPWRPRVGRWAGMAACLLLGMAVFLGAAFARQFWTAGTPIRTRAGYRSAAEIQADYHLYRSLEGRYGLFARRLLQPRLRESYLAAAGAVIDAYRLGAEPSIERFPWRKAQTCLERALELDPADRVARGQLALCRGYGYLLIISQWKGAGDEILLSWRNRARDRFEEAGALWPSAPDPHLGQARVYALLFHDIARATAELDRAEKLGYECGPREYRLQAEAFRYRSRTRKGYDARRDLETAKSLEQFAASLERER